MTVTITEQERREYEPPTLTDLGSLTELAVGAGTGGTLIVMQSAIPVAPD